MKSALSMAPTLEGQSRTATGNDPSGRFCIPRHEFLAWHSDTLRRIYADRKSMTVAIANDCGVSPKLAESYISTPPRQSISGWALSQLLANNPVYAAEHRRLLAMNADLDPEYERAQIAFLRALVFLKEGR